MLSFVEVESCAAWSEKRDPGQEQITGKTRANAVSVSPSRDEECFELNEFERALQLLALGCKSVNKSRASGTQGTQGEPDRAGPHRKDALSTQCCVVGKSALAIDRQQDGPDQVCNSLFSCSSKQAMTVGAQTSSRRIRDRNPSPRTAVISNERRSFTKPDLSRPPSQGSRSSSRRMTSLSSGMPRTFAVSVTTSSGH